MKKWYYLNNMGTLAFEEQGKQIKDHCNTDGPEDASKFEDVPFHVIKNLIEEAKAAVKAPEPKKESKQKNSKKIKTESVKEN